MVSRSESSRPSEISALMSSLMNVLLMAWIARPGFAVRAPSRIGRTGARSGPTRVSSPSMRPTIRTVDPSGDTRPASGGAENGSVSWSNVGVWTPASGAPAARSWATTSPTAAVNAGSAVAPGASADDDDDLFERVVGPARGEDVVGLARLELPLVGVLVGIGRVDPTHRQADEQQPDRHDEPQADDGPAMTSAPHRDPDGGGLPARFRLADGHALTVPTWVAAT